MLFLTINCLVYLISNISEKLRIQLVLQDKLNTLETHYEILMQTQKVTASALYQSTIEQNRVAEIMSEASGATLQKKALLRDELKKLLAFKYNIAKQQGIVQYQFVLPNNESFLRMLNPSDFGDNIADTRYDFVYTNRTKQPISGFVQSKTEHGFSNIFPLFDKNGQYAGAVEISFSSDNIQWYLNNISRIHTHFLIYKNIFNTETFKRKEIPTVYAQSAENPNFTIIMDREHTQEKCIDEDKIKLEPVREEIITKMSQESMFTLYVNFQSHVEVVSFLPVKDIENNTTAWLVSYEISPYIELTLQSSLIIRMVLFFASIVLIYLIFKQIQSKELIEQNKKEKQAAIEEKAYFDNLTKVYNRNKFDEFLDQEIIRVKRYKNPLSIAILDIDKFKNFNDTYGHLVGDEILIMIAQNINSNVRASDTFARWGGEEFVILFRETDAQSAKIIVQKLKEKIQELQHPTAGGVTASFGITEYLEDESIETLFKRCDKALYLAKENGRNRVEIL